MSGMMDIEWLLWVDIWRLGFVVLISEVDENFIFTCDPEVYYHKIQCNVTGN